MTISTAIDYDSWRQSLPPSEIARTVSDARARASDSRITTVARPHTLSPTRRGKLRIRSWSFTTTGIVEPPEPEPSVQDWVEQIRKDLRVPWAPQLSQRLRDLIHIAAEEAPEQAPLNPASLRGLLDLLTAVRGIAEPSLVLTAEGNIRARWRQDANHHFAVTFLNDRDVHYVLFAPDPAHPYKTARVSGSGTVDSLMGVMAPYRVCDWVAPPAFANQSG